MNVMILTACAHDIDRMPVATEMLSWMAGLM